MYITTDDWILKRKKETVWFPNRRRDHKIYSALNPGSLENALEVCLDTNGSGNIRKAADMLEC